MDIIDYDGHDWMRGHGFPGWSSAWVGIAITLIAGGAPAGVGWQLAHGIRDWSGSLAILSSLLDLGGLVLCGVVVALLALFAISGVREWMTVYLIRTEATAIIVEFQRYGGVARDRHELPTATVSEVTTKMASASGDTIITDVCVRQDGRPLKVFRSSSPTEVEMLVIYLNAACGRHAGAGTAAGISAQWAAMKANIEARKGKGAAALPSPAATPPAP